MSNNIEGNVVVIMGASSGLGEATARFLSAQSATMELGALKSGLPWPCRGRFIDETGTPC